MFRFLAGKLARGTILRSILGSVGGAAAAAIGFKLASDLYDLVKRRMAQASPEADELDGRTRERDR